MLKTLIQTISPQKEAKKIRPWGAMGFDDDENEISIERHTGITSSEQKIINFPATGSFSLNEKRHSAANISSDNGKIIDFEAYKDRVKETGSAVASVAGDLLQSTPGAVLDLVSEGFIGHYKESDKPKKTKDNSPDPKLEAEEKVNKEIVSAQQQEQSRETEVKIVDITQERFIRDVCRVGGDEAATMTSEQKNTKLGKQANFKTPDNIHDLVELRRIMKGEEKVVEKIEEAQDAQEITPKGSYLNQNLNHEGAGAGSSTKAA